MCVIKNMSHCIQSGLHRRNFINNQTDDIPMNTINLVSPMHQIHAILEDDISSEEEDCPKKPYQTKILILTTWLVKLVFVSSLSWYFVSRTDSSARKLAEPLDPIDPLPPSASKLRVFQKAAVCTDSPLCSKIGRYILINNGSAVDATLAAMFCDSIYNQQSVGIGGGFFMMVYIKEEGKAYSVNAREKAPGAASKDMFHGDAQKASTGGLAVGVPGELRGMWAAHKRWGKLPWRSLVAPTLKICKFGYTLSNAVVDDAQRATYIQNDPNLNLPVIDCIEIAKRKLQDNNMPIEYAELLKHCLTSGYLMWKDEFYVQVDGVAMGSPVSHVVADIYMEHFEARALSSAPAMPKIFKRKTFWDSSKNRFHKPGTRVKPFKAICNTLRIIAENGGDELYNGTLAVKFLEDLNRAGSIITAEDLENYHPKITDPIAITLSNEDTLYTPPPPSSGAILVNIMNILNSYNFTVESINGTNNKILTYHRILEAFKFGYAARTKLGDMDFLDLDWFLRIVTSLGYGSRIQKLINDKTTSNDTKYYGNEEYVKPDSGTAHMSILAENGDAVSVTSSINYYFGAGFTTLNTGIVMNNVMDDFSSPGFTNYYGVQPSPANFIEPNKRPLSTMSPGIIVDKNGNVKLVIGAAGGTKILSAMALVTMRKLWFDQTIKQAVDEARIHHQTLPMHVEYEFGITEKIVEGLRAKGHGMVRYRARGSVVSALYKNETGIYAIADFRKGGDVAGID